MKYSVSFEVIAQPDSPILLDVATGLQELRARPESLVWSIMPSGIEARIWMIIEAGAPRMEALAAHFRTHEAIRKIRITEDWPLVIPADPPIVPAAP